MEYLFSIISQVVRTAGSVLGGFVQAIRNFLLWLHTTAESEKRLWQTSLVISQAKVHPITVIIPTLNEAAHLSNTIVNLFSACTLSSTTDCPDPDVIIVDANSQDGTLSSISELLTRYPTIRTYCQKYPSRGAQQNYGASQAASDTAIFLFLHADTILPHSWDTTILSTLTSPQCPAIGTFSLSLPPPISASLQIMLLGAKLRAKYFGLPYGDQAFFLRRTTFQLVDKFPNVPIMEDVELLKRIKRIGGGIRVLEEEVITSPRRWKKKGVWRNTMYNQCFMIAWFCGTSPNRIYEWYYGVKYVDANEKES
jgi:rSAM/selenodomain-associated transferase 2